MRGACRLVTVLLAGAVGLAGAQPGAPPFGRSESAPESRALPERLQRALDLEQRFFSTEKWTFYHAVSDLPPDMRIVLSRAAGSDVVGPGEPIDIMDVVSYPRRVQHLYTAVTTEVGVIVWYTGGGETWAHAVIYDRNARAACRYKLGPAGPVLPIGLLANLIRTRFGLTQGGCEYLAPEFFE
jgi:hypothetical protein